MTKSGKHVAWAGVGLTLALTVGSPAIADDVELLLSIPGASNAAKPNILFILDSSGSMRSIETSQEPFDGTDSYSGPCDDSYYYWTTTGGVPSCSTDRKIDKPYFVCAQGVTQVTASGKYTDTMAMYRRRNGKWKWRNLQSGTTNRAVECATDSGQHGNGTPGEVYARIGSNVPPFTSSDTQEVDWGSSPTQQIVTVYDGNYLNWYYNPPGTSMSRTDIVKAVTKNVLGSIQDVNVGFMRFHYSQGGPVTHAIKDLDTYRSAATSTVDALPASGWTPLSETMYEAALYWRGMNNHYGQPGSTDPDAVEATAIAGDGSTILDYDQPVEYACAKNFNVLLTDGAPTQDTGAYPLVPTLPNYTITMGRSNCNGGNVNGACLDDIAEYLSKEDINPTVPGDQTVTTYTIGFRVDLPLLKDTAENSGGQYYLAEDVQSLTDALTDIVTNIFDRDISFTAPAVAVNAFNRTQHLNDLYVSVFRATDQFHWPGNMKKYTIADSEVVDANSNPAIDPATGYFADGSKNFWNPNAIADGPNVSVGGAANLLPNPASRKLFTNNGAADLTAASNAISSANAGNYILADFGLTGGPGDPDLYQIIEWARGVDVRDEDNDPNTLVRKKMGDTLHSQPASVVYGDGGGSLLDIVVFVATNDGYLHAIDATTGQEMWSFVPKEVLDDFGDLFFNETVNFKHYAIDGDIVPIIADRNENGVIEVGTDFVYLVFGMRRGGDNYYMLDVTDKNAPKLKWIRTYPQFGQTWSAPIVSRVDVNSPAVTSPDDAVLVLGAGYDTVHDQSIYPSTIDAEGTGIFMLDLETGDQLWRAGFDFGADLRLTRMTRAVPSRIRVLDMSGDGYADRMYAADLGGQIWRFDINNGQTPTNLVAGGVIAQFGAEGTESPSPAQTRRFYTTPDISMFQDLHQNARYLAVSIGSGYRAHPLDNSAQDRFYSLRDPHIFQNLSQAQYDSYPIATDADMAEVSGTTGTNLNFGDRGWKFTLPPGQKVLAGSRTFDNSIYFVSFESQSASADPCRAGLSVNRLYRVDVVNGDPVVDLDSLDPYDADAADDARVTELKQGGIATDPIFLFPSPLDPENCQGEECSPPPLGCVGVECFNSGFANNPVRTLWTQDGIE